METQQAACLLQSLRSLHQHLESDLTLVLEDSGRRKFHVHKTVVALFSGYFRSLLEDGKLTGSEHKLAGVSPEEMHILVEYMYKGGLQFTEDNFRGVLSSAEMLQMPLVVEECREFARIAGLVHTLEPGISGDTDVVTVDESSTSQGGIKSQEASFQPNDAGSTTRVVPTRKQKADEAGNSEQHATTSKSTRGRKRKEGLRNQPTDGATVVLHQVEDDFGSDLRRSARKRTRLKVSDQMPESVRKQKKDTKRGSMLKIADDNKESIANQSSTSDSDTKRQEEPKIQVSVILKNRDGKPTAAKRGRVRPKRKVVVKTEKNAEGESNQEESSILTVMKEDCEKDEKSPIGEDFEDATEAVGVKDRQAVRIIDPEKISKCDICKKRFIYYSQYQLHMQSHGYLALRHKRPSTVIQSKASKLVRRRLTKGLCKISGHYTGNVSETSDTDYNTNSGNRSANSDGKERYLGASKDLPDLVARIHEYSSIGPNQAPLLEAAGLQMPTPQGQETCVASESYLEGQRDKLGSVRSMKAGIIQRCFGFNENDGKRYECTVCGRGFPLYVLCKRHCMEHHCQRFRCVHCAVTVTSQQALLEHRRLLHAEKSLFSVVPLLHCTICKRKMASNSDLEDHKTAGCDRKPVFKCLACAWVFEAPAVFLKHHCIPKLDKNDLSISRGFKQRRKLFKAMIKQVPTENGSKFMCNVNCRRSSKSLFLARIHAIHKHKKSKLYNTVKTQIPTMRFPCSEKSCSHKAATYMKLISHVKSCHPDASYQCQKCPYVTNLRGNLDVHFQQKHSSKIQCSLCDKTYSKTQQLKIHQASIHGIKDPSVQEYHCPIPSCEYIAYQKTCMTQHMNRHVMEKPFSCRECGLKLKTEKNLEKHMNKVHLGIRPYICDQCGATYGEASELKTHIARHSPTRKFSCEFCSYSTTAKGNLKTHMWSQHRKTMDSKQKLFKCDICEYTTDRKARHREHYDSHNSIRKYHCDQCQQSFVTKNTLLGHIKWKHKAKSFKCDFCDHQTGSMYHLREHVRRKHTHKDVKPYKCPYCSFYCATSGNCRKHVMNKHRGLKVYYLVMESSMQQEGMKRPEHLTKIEGESTDIGSHSEKIHKLQTIEVTEAASDSNSTLQSFVLNSNVTKLFSQVPTTTIQGHGLENTAVPIYQIIEGSQDQVLPEIEVQVFEQSELPESTLFPVSCDTVACPEGVVYGSNVLVDSNVTLVTEEACPSSAVGSTQVQVLPPSGEHAYYGTAP